MPRLARLAALALLPAAAVACAGGPTAPVAEPQAEVRLGEVVPWYRTTAPTAADTTTATVTPRAAGEVVPWY